jgi:hypothetical protein
MSDMIFEKARHRYLKEVEKRKKKKRSKEAGYTGLAGKSSICVCDDDLESAE